jgi:PAS domain S-box-containing protein
MVEQPARRALLVDDTEANRYAVGRMLRRAGFEVIEAATGEDALRLAGTHADLALVVLDVRLPDIDGYEVCRRLKADPRTAPVIVLQMSASFVRPEDQAAGLDSGADGYLVQPVDERLFSSTVGALMRARAAEQALRQSEATLGAVLDALPVGVVIADADGRLLRDNAANRQLWGVPPQTTSWEQYGQWVGYRPETGERLRAEDWAMSRALLHGEVVHDELVECERFGTGERRLFLNNAAPVRDPSGKIIGGVVAEQDVTERLTTLRALREGEERLRLTLAGAHAGVWETNLQTGQAVWSPEMFELLGVDPTLAPSFAFFRSLILPEDRAECDRTFAQSLQTSGNFDLEFRICRPSDGRIVWLSAVGRVECDASGTPCIARGINQDITGRKQAEESLREADRRKDEFLATLAHELRNPMAAIRSAIDLLQVGPGGTGSGPDREVVEMLDRQATQVTHLLDDLLDVSRISRGKITLRRERIELAAVLRHAVETAGPLCRAKQQVLTASLPDEPLAVHADVTRLTQVVGNLLNNASKFTPAGGRVMLSATREGEQAVIRVRDDGIGIPPDQVERVFDLFTQVDNTPGRVNAGLGIGLSLVQRLVQMHGGDVSAHSEGEGRGSEFVVRLPLMTGPAPAAEPDTSAPRRTGVRRRILVVDDNRDSIRALAKLLSLRGHEVHTAFDGLEAVDAAERVRPDAILLDIGLPGIDGYEAARRIRGRIAAARPLMVALTGWGQDEDRARSRDAGFDAHLVKPVSVDILCQLLMSAAETDA